MLSGAIQRDCDGQKMHTNRFGPGQVVDDEFHLVREIGCGSYGMVFEAVQIRLGRRVAIKILHPDVARSKAAAERFRREARIASSLTHPRAVSIYTYGFHHQDGLSVPYIAMELLNGEDLNGALARRGHFESDEVRLILREALDPLIEAHAAGIVHRDLKPENLFLCRTNGQAPVVKVLDFGIARAIEGAWGMSMVKRLTVRGGLCGTPHYMAPELAQCVSDITPAVDVYALGCIGYEMLCGHPPFDAPYPLRVVMMHIEDKVPPLPEHIEPALRRAIERAMAKEPLQRHSDATQFATALDELWVDTEEMPAGAALAESVRLVVPPWVQPASIDEEAPPNSTDSVATRRTDPLPPGSLDRESLLESQPQYDELPPPHRRQSVWQGLKRAIGFD